MKPQSSIAGWMCVALIAAAPAHALDPARSIAQYKHTRWTIDDGAPAPLLALAQGRDGYLWVAGAGGLYRFDGIGFERIPWQQPPPSGGSISSIMVARNGDVWVGYSTGGTAVYRRGSLKDLPMPKGDYVMDMVETPGGSIWATVGRKVHQLYRFRSGRWAEVGSRMGLPDDHLIRMITTRDGALLVTTASGGLFFLRPGAQRFERSAEVFGGHASLSEDGGGNIWVSDKSGSRPRFSDWQGLRPRTLISYPTPEARRKTQTFFDRDGNLWGFTEQGIYRLRHPVTQGARSKAQAIDSVTRYQAKDGLVSDSVRSILEDREGNIWVASVLGLDRFRAASVIIEPALTNRAIWNDVLLRGTDGTVYVGESDAVYRIRPGGAPEAILRTTADPLALCEGPDGAIWIVLPGRVLRMKGSQTTKFPGPGTDTYISDCAIDTKNQIWTTANRSGLFRRVAGAWRQSMVPPAQGGFPPTSLLRQRDGKMLLLFNALAYVDPPNPPKMLFALKNGPNSLRTIFRAPGRILFGGPDGIGEVRMGRVRLLSSRRFPALNNVSGIAQTATGQTWVSTDSGPIMMATQSLDRALADPKASLPMRNFNFRDGLIAQPGRESVRSVVAGGDGRIWFAIGTGTVWIDSNHLARETLIPPVRISAFSANGETIRDPAAVQPTAGTTSVEISFAALSLSIPERVRVRYRLSGDGRGWIDPGMRRQAFYTNLGPGHYIFQVIAANHDGVWNRTGATLTFDIPPTFFQSKWFLALCIGAFSLVLWGAYRIRIRQLTGRLRERLEQRLAERERIARDLHDTLLQGFQGLILRFQSVANEIPQHFRAHGLLGEALDLADKVMSDGRDSVLLLRTVGSTDIGHCFSETANRMSFGHPAEFRMVVEGKPRSLHPIVRDEICRIGEEAIVNAFQHGKAKLIEVALSYSATELTLGIRDDGIGIDPEIFDAGGRQGHFGIVGMKERATQLDAEFNLSSQPQAGTEIRLTVAGKVAYVSPHRSKWRMWRRFPLLTTGGSS